MNTNTHTLWTREEVELLLPWYVTGKLDPAEMAQVRTYLETHSDLQDSLDLARAERNETLHLNEEVAASRPQTSPDSFIASLPQRAGPERFDLVSWIKSLVPAPSPAAIGWAGAVAALIIMIQASVIVTQLRDDAATGYREAAGITTPATAGAFALVRFADTASAGEISSLLSELDMSIADGPKAGQLFKVRIGPDSLSSDDRTRRIAVLKARSDVVAFVTLSK